MPRVRSKWPYAISIHVMKWYSRRSGKPLNPRMKKYCSALLFTCAAGRIVVAEVQIVPTPPSIVLKSLRGLATFRLVIVRSTGATVAHCTIEYPIESRFRPEYSTYPSDTLLRLSRAATANERAAAGHPRECFPRRVLGASDTP